MYRWITHIEEKKKYTVTWKWFVIFFSFCFVSAYPNRLFFKNVSVNDGLSQGIVYCIHQDTKGFMWFGTGEGLNRYDGYEFKVFKNVKGDTTSISNNLINCIEEDRDGNLWIGTMNGLNCYNLQTESFTRYLSQPDNAAHSLSDNYVKSLFLDGDSLLWIGTDMYLNSLNLRSGEFKPYDFDGILADSRIFDIHKDIRGDIWLATRVSGLIRFNPQTGGYKQYVHDPANPRSISDNHTYVLFEDSFSQLWIGTWEYGLNRFVREKDEFERMLLNKDGTGLNNNQIRCILEDESSNLWIGTSEGLNVLNAGNNRFEYHLRHNNELGTLSYNTVNCMFEEKTGTVWLGTNGGGINIYNPILGQFELIDPKPMNNHDYGFIGPMVESDGKIWIGTEGGGLAFYDLKTKEYHFFDLDNPSRKNLYSNTIKALAVDKTKTLWIGTYAAGIQTFDIKNRTFGRYYNSLDGINNNIVNDIFVDHQDNIWVGTNTLNGLHLKEKCSDDFTTGLTVQDSTGRMDFPWIRTICETKGNGIWFGSIYYGVFIYENGKSARRIFVENSDLSCDYISTIMEDSKGHIWIGTYGGGVNIYYPETGIIRSFNTDDGLLNNNVCCIIEDPFSTIWISTAAGLSKCNVTDYSFVNYSYGKLSFPVEVLNLKSGLLASDGNIYIGGSNGIACFSPGEIKNNDFIPAIKATHLYINNKLVQVADDTHILSKSITETSSLVLKYNQTNILIRFAALNYLLPQNNQYMYYLEGYDKQWNKESFQRQVTYTNLPSGKYTLKVKASNNSGIWNETGVSIDINVLPPPWKTWWAYCLYFLFVMIIIFVIINYFVSRVKMENNIRLKQIEQQAIEEAHQVKLNMFTNFSHELRTPLTLIINPVKEILSDTSLAAIYKESLRLVYRNANRMLLLVNQLLDVRKQEAGAVTIKVKEANLIKFIREIVIIFRELSKSKHIELSFSAGQNVLRLYYDAGMLEKVFYNILSNAIKNTPVYAKIDVEVFQASYETVHRDMLVDADEGRQIGLAGSYIVCNIKDTGKGIPAEDLKKIFMPFFQVDENDLSGIKGTGLGLHIAKTIMEQHHGMIRAFNNPDRGACFQLIFPVNKSLYSDNQIDAMPQPYVMPAVGTGEGAVMTDGGPKKNNASLKILKKDTPVVLIVDDNSDIRLFMSSQLRNDYIVCEAENGETAWEKAQEIVPDLILCDIMMPVMNGLELCTSVKNDLKTCHIPVILLTARSSMLHVEEGLMTGADDYITKPFDAGLLKIRIKNAIENRRKAKDSYLKNFTIDIPTPLSSQMDEAFLSKSYEYVKLNLDNTELNIDAFGKYMCLSRTQLYRKIKALTGKSPSQFVSTLRLKYAAELLATTTLSIQEIADRTGFNNASYFTTSFKKLYGTTPTEYVQSKKAYSRFLPSGT